jgi:hypothetical protein
MLNILLFATNREFFSIFNQKLRIQITEFAQIA